MSDAAGTLHVGSSGEGDVTEHLGGDPLGCGHDLVSEASDRRDSPMSSQPPARAIEPEMNSDVAHVGKLDLDALARRMAKRDPMRTEANLQSDLHALLLGAPLELEESDLQDLEVTLEQQAGSGLRIDVEAGRCVFEVKRDLRKGKIRQDAIKQLAGYVSARTEAMQQRYVGVLTDGAEWLLFQLVDGALHHVSTRTLDAGKPDIEGLTVWLEGVLATADKITPTPHEIDRRLGAESPGHKLDYAEIKSIYEKHRNVPGVRLKRELWARLLTTAFGTGFSDSDDLFVEHTLLVATAEVIAHAVIGLDPTAQDVSAATIVSGHLFTVAQVHGVVDADFFDWIVEVKGGEGFIKSLARRLSRFAWQDVEHDVLKVLYESIISTAQRKKLGEYYTPDWLANRVVDAVVAKPLKQRVLDPACGSGTFLFHAIRRYLDAAKAAGMSDAAALTGVTERVIGMDIHPVAVTFARVTYLLAIGPERLKAPDRPPLSIPVYLGDSIQWGQERTLFTANALVVPTTNSGELWATDLRFPASAISDAAKFDRLVSELADLASINRVAGAPTPSLAGVFRRYSIADADQPAITETFKTLCRLHDTGNNHIWGYYVRNLARPFWLARPPNRVDVLVGNPPWLSYRFMTPEMQQQFRALSEERKLWTSAAVATNQDLSALFVLRSIERYLPAGGRFGFVMPWAVLRGRQFTGFRRGTYDLRNEVPLTVHFEQPWDLHGITPTFFPVPPSVVSGERVAGENALPMPSTVETWKGRVPQINISWDKAAPHVVRGTGEIKAAGDVAKGKGSPYQTRFSQGATVVPRFLLVVEETPVGPLGAGAGRIAVRSRRSATEKNPWKTLPPLEGNVDRQFVKPLHVGDTILPYRTLTPRRSVVPWDGKQMLDSNERLALYPGLANWWTRAEAIWTKYRSSERLTLLGRLNYQRGLSNQLPIIPGVVRVVYTKSGMYLAAAIVTDDSVIDHKLYWGTVASLDEGRYLEAVLNSDITTAAVRPLQARGEHNPRDFDKYIWQLPIPVYDAQNERHRRLVMLAESAEKIAAGIALPEGKRFETLRRLVRHAVADSETGKQIEIEVSALLGLT